VRDTLTLKSIGFVTGIRLEEKLLLKTFKRQGLPAPMTACAGGTVEGARKVARALIEQGATRLISFGVCGGLAPDIKSGDLILADHIMMEGATLSVDPAWHKKISQQLPDAKTGTIVSVKEAVTTPQAKARIFAQSGAVAVDVETYAVMQAAKAHNLPGLIIRAVLDPADQALPQAALGGVNANGETQIWPVIKGLIRRPQDLPDLIRLGRQNKQACKVLEGAIEDCRGAIVTKL